MFMPELIIWTWNSRTTILQSTILQLTQPKNNSYIFQDSFQVTDLQTSLLLLQKTRKNDNLCQDLLLKVPERKWIIFNNPKET